MISHTGVELHDVRVWVETLIFRLEWNEEY